MKRFLLAIVLIALSFGSARADIGGVPFGDRMFFVASGGYQQWDGTTAARLGASSEFAPMVGLALSTGREIQFAFSERMPVQSKLWMFEPGVRWMIVTDGTGRAGQLAWGVNGVFYHGDGAEKLGGDQWSWNTGLYGSYNIAGNQSKPLRWYVSGSVVVDPNGDIADEEDHAKVRYGADVRAVYALKEIF